VAWQREQIEEKMSENRLPTNLRTLLILEIIGNSEEALSPTEVAHKIGLPKQTVHRLCATLVDERFLVREMPGNKLRPARRLRSIASGVLHSSRYHIARHQILVDVARQIGETVNYVMPEDDGMAYKDRVETDWAFRVQLPVGTNVPFHATASGKCFLASLRKGDREKLVRDIAMEKQTDNTINDPEALLLELKQISRRGYAIDNEEFMDGMVAMAVPVLDERNRFLASLAFHGPSMRLDISDVIEKKDILIDAADKLTQLAFLHE